MRANKAAIFEGGICGIGFAWGSKLPKPITNWFMQLTGYQQTVEGIAGLELDKNKWKLD